MAELEGFGDEKDLEQLKEKTEEVSEAGESQRAIRLELIRSIWKAIQDNQVGPGVRNDMYLYLIDQQLFEINEKLETLVDALAEED